MQVSVLFSGGKDSSLSAILLEPFFEVELVTCGFSLLPIGEVASETAEALGFPHRQIKPDISILEKAYDMIMQDGFPKNAINFIHKSVIEYLAADNNITFIADGIRRDDRVPVMGQPEIRSIEDRFGVHYICPLKGFGRAAVNELVKEHLVIDEGLSENVLKADYETELRELISQRHGPGKIKEIFPTHVQSHVIERRKAGPNRTT
ncbi:alpha hydrolase [Methanolobus mangrovi]|uniref:Alpha hydrolase n=1 Tax=Methanolobus mangrovi TaxID=3072977 RepID=A0AA51UK59_9EURY|nr:alpha hydrolase [Methanolobus mangrovi]WMW23186.1 alpha hydrolase [Methanolobus mangrovi]